MPDRALTKLDKAEARLEDLRASLAREAFDFYYKHADVDLAGNDKRWREAVLGRDVGDACAAVSGGGYDTAAERRAEILSDWVTLERAATDEIIELKNEIQRIVLETKPVLDGEEIPRHQRTQVLLKNPSREKRRRAYLADGRLREELAGRGRRLYRLRNDAARALGYDNYPAMMLAVEGLTVAELEAIFDRYEEETRGSFEDLKAEGARRFGLDNVEPWDVLYVTDKLCAAPDKHFPAAAGLATVAAVVRGLGRDLDALDIAVYGDADIPYGGLCFAIRIPDDVRILVNLKDGMSNYGVLYHEFGHAVHRKFTAAPTYSLKAGDAGFFTEAMADVWGQLVGRREWLEGYTSMSAAEIDAVEKAAAWAFASRTRRFMAEQAFEIDAYLHADGDLDGLRHKHAARFLGYRDDVEDGWAEVYFPHLYPVYSKNYMLARVIQRAIYGRLEGEFGRIVGEPRVFDYLVDNFYAAGALNTWKEKLAATGAAVL